MSIRRDDKIILPLHIPRRHLERPQFKLSEDVRQASVQLRVGEIDADARARALRKGQEAIFDLCQVAVSGEPAFWVECVGRREVDGVEVVDIADTG